MQAIKFDENQQPFIDLGNGFKIRLEDEPPTDPKYLEKAKVELREEPQRQKEAIGELKELLKADKNFSFPHEDDSHYITYLRPCHYYPQSAHDKLLKYFKFKLKHKKVCENLTAESLRTVFEEGLLKYYPVRDKNGCRLIYVHGGKNWKPAKVPLTEIFRAIQLSLQAAMLEPMSQINGVCVILDTDGLSLSQICHFTPMFAAMVLEWLQECVPLRLKGFYVINNSYIFNIVFKIFNAKLRKRIHFIGKDWNTLHDFLGKECLARNFEGELEAQEVDGKILTDLLSLLGGRLEVINKGGFAES